MCCLKVYQNPRWLSKRGVPGTIPGRIRESCGTMNRDNAALPSDVAPDPDFGGPGGMAPWQSTESLAFAYAYAHRGEPGSPQPCRTAESPLARTSARLGGY